MGILTESELMGIRSELARRQVLLHERLKALAEKKAAKRKGTRKVLGSGEQGASGAAGQSTNGGGAAGAAPARRGRKPKSGVGGKESPTPEQEREKAIASARRIGATDEQLRAMGLLPALPAEEKEEVTVEHVKAAIEEIQTQVEPQGSVMDMFS